MERLTTDNPRDNIETALNLFYIKDGETWVRGGGDAPGYPDVRLFDYARKLIRAHGAEELIEPDSEDQELADQIAECLFDGVDTIEGLIATLYTAAWAFSALREKLKRYEDAENEKRFIYPPCKVGDTLYEIDLPEYGVIVCKVRSVFYVSKHHADREDLPVVSALSVAVEVIDGHGVGSCYAFEREDFGKTVFLTRQEAEAALANLQDKS